jgi:hypothetical protein
VVCEAELPAICESADRSLTLFLTFALPTREIRQIAFDALPRLKPMGFGDDSATSLLRGLTGGSRPETAPSLQNIVCGVEVTIFHVPATATDEDPHIERHLLAVLAKVTQLGCGLPTVNLDQLFTKLGGHPSGFEQELE